MRIGIFKKQKKDKKEEEEKYELFRNKCPLCKSGDFKPLFDDYAECIDCGHIYHQNLELIAKKSANYKYCQKCGRGEFKILSDGKVECSACKYVFSQKKEEKKEIQKEIKDKETEISEKKEITFKEERFDLESATKDSLPTPIECPKCGSLEIEQYINGKYKCKDCGYRFLREILK